jgi:menaquinone-specific isochorismate synthase
MDHFSDSMAWLARRDGSAVIGHGPFEASAEPPSQGLAFYVQDFAMTDPAPWKTPDHAEKLTAAGLAGRFVDAAADDFEWAALDPASFSVVFQEVMACVHGGIFEKTVPVVTECGTANRAPGPAIIAAMTRQAAPLYSYGWVGGSCGFAGATPELLFALDGNRLETMALAGTARSEDREVFAVDEKEIREHEYVAQTLVSKLLDLGRVERLSREILDLGPIVHFLTTIGLDLQTPQTAEHLLRRLHPTPALGPLPRTDETLGRLLEWRNRLGCPAQFGAPFGLWDEGRFDAIVAIRGIWWDREDLMLPAGCGIIEASRLVNEWRELRLKREAVKRFLTIPRVPKQQPCPLRQAGA